MVSLAAQWFPELSENFVPSLGSCCAGARATNKPKHAVTPWRLPAHAAPVLDAEYVRGPGLGYGSALRLHGHSQAQPGNWFPPSPPPPNPLKHKRFLTTVTGGRDSTFVLNLHLAVCIYAGFLKTALGMIVVQDKVQFVWHKEDCRERWPGGQYRGSSLGFLIFFFLIFTIGYNLVPHKGNNLFPSKSSHKLQRETLALLRWEEEPHPKMVKKIHHFSFTPKRDFSDFSRRERGSLPSSRIQQNKIRIPFFKLKRKKSPEMLWGCARSSWA